MPNTHVRVGRAGEYTAAGIITTLADVDVNIVTQPHYDLLAHFEEFDLKIQVKASSKNTNKPAHLFLPSLQFQDITRDKTAQTARPGQIRHTLHDRAAV